LHLRLGVRRQIDGDIAQILDVQPEVDARALGTAVAEQIADRLEWRSLPKQMDGQGVTKTVWSLVPDGQTTAPHTPLKGFSDGSRLERASWGSFPEEDLPV
jgi:hypothetical protein